MLCASFKPMMPSRSCGSSVDARRTPPEYNQAVGSAAPGPGASVSGIPIRSSRADHA